MWKQRAIKFMVWGGYYSMGGSPPNENKMYGPYTLETLHKNPPPHKVAQLQFTGLMDDIDVELYEAFIVEDDNGAGVVTWELATAGFVVWTPDAPYYLNEGDTSRPLKLQNTRIIGNIFENPELIPEGWR